MISGDVPLYSARVPIAPPSVNNLYPTVRRGARIPSREYDRWRRMVAPFFPPIDKPITGMVAISVHVGVKLSRADADNLLKAPIDMLVTRRIIQSDSKSTVRAVALNYEPGNKLTVCVWRWVDGSGKDSSRGNHGGIRAGEEVGRGQ